MFNPKLLFSVSCLDPLNPVLQKRLDTCPTLLTTHAPTFQQSGIVLLGVHGSGKTTLMFQQAFSIVRDDPDSKVMILLHRNSSPPIPIFPEDDPEVSACLRRIEVKYIDTYNLLVAFLANLQLLGDDELPHYLFVDNLSSFFATHHKDNPHLAIINMEDEEGEEFNFALLPDQQQQHNQLLGSSGSRQNVANSAVEALHIRVFALLQNTCQFLSKKFTDRNINFLITDLDETYPFYSRWCPLVLTIDHFKEDGLESLTNTTNQPQFILKVGCINEMSDPYRFKAVYELSESKCTLKKLDYAIPKYSSSSLSLTSNNR